MRSVCAGGCGRPRIAGPDFYLSGGLPRQKCKKCLAKDARNWRKANPAKHRASRWKANHQSHLKRRFGLTPAEYDALVAQSDGLCGICRKPETRARRIALDHDHATGEIRGFLCSGCNLLLGNAKDSIDLLEQAIQYLKKSKEKFQ